MVSIALAKSTNASTRLNYKPVALFVGGTSGIGQASAEALARSLKGNVHIIICGRNESAGKSIIASLPQTPTSKYEFLPCDVSLMSNIKAACASLTSPTRPGGAITKLNYLFMSPGYLALKGFDATAEGIDRKLACHFYSRFKFTLELMPLLEAAKAAGEDARVVTMLAAGHGGKIDLDDLGLKKSYTTFKSSMTSPTYNSLAVEELAKRHPGISFTHSHPGVVNTSLFGTGLVATLAQPLMWALATSPADCGEWMIQPLLDSQYSSGAFHLDNKSEAIPKSKLHLTDEAQAALWAHAVEETSTH